eukprot:PhM_4_TR18741/c2_g1_i1/m.1515/K11838/USP7, UBP15; ubiquitin carboxyl-terminal hydrolase 7
MTTPLIRADGFSSSSDDDESIQHAIDDTNRQQQQQQQQQPAVDAPAAVSVVPYVGLVNQGATCYLNSLLQVLYHLGTFRGAVYAMPTQKERNTIPKALQNVFYQLQHRSVGTAGSTSVLTNAFGWDERAVWVQHDIQELATKLRDTLTERMKGTPQAKVNAFLFEGEQEQVIECTDGSYTSTKKSIFYDVQLEVRGFRDVYASFDELTKTETLDGDNKYKVEFDDGRPAEYKAANKFTRFLSLPRVLLLHLQRFTMDLMSPTLDMMKINDRYQYEESLDLSRYMPSGTPPEDCIYDLYGVIVHGGTVRVGHYRAFVRPQAVEEIPDESVDGNAAAVRLRWSPWYEFDDEDVRVVRRDAAVKDLFGGTAVNAAGYTYTKSTNAYILVYIRRSEAAQLLSCSESDVIPEFVQREFEAQLAAEEKEQREAQIRNAKVTIRVVTERFLQQEVNQHQWDLLTSPIDATAQHPECYVQTYEKSNSFSLLVADINARWNVAPERQRLWTWHHHYRGNDGYRPDACVTQRQFKNTFFEVLHKTTTETGPWIFDLLLETPNLYAPHHIVNIAPRGLAHASSSEEGCEPRHAVLHANEDMQWVSGAHDPAPYWELDLKVSYLIENIILQWRPTMPRLGNITVQLFDDSGACTWGKALLGPPTGKAKDPTFTRVNDSVPMRVMARKVRIQKKGPNLALHEVQVIVDRIHAVQSVLPSAAPHFPNKNLLLLVIKVYDPALACVVYGGLLFVDESHSLKQYLPHLRRVLGVDDRTAVHIIEEAKFGTTLVIDLDEPIRYLALQSGNILTIQAVHTNDMISNVNNENKNQNSFGLFRCPTVASYYDELVLRRGVYFYSLNNCNNNNNNSHHHNGNNEVVAFLRLLGNMTYGTITEQLGMVIHVDPAYIRLTGYDRAHDAPMPEPMPSYLNPTLDALQSCRYELTSRDTCKLWFEVLATPLANVERNVKVCVEVRDELGENPTMDVAEVERSATVKQLLDVVVGADDAHRYALLVVRDHNIEHVYEATEPVPVLHVQQSSLQIRPFPPFSQGFPLEHQKLVRVCFAQGAFCHSTPFLIWVGHTETVQQVAARIDAMMVAGDDGPVALQHWMGSVAQSVQLAPTDVLTQNFDTTLDQVVIPRQAPKERPGSRYVPRREPQLVLSDGVRDEPSPKKLCPTTSTSQTQQQQ